MHIVTIFNSPPSLHAAKFNDKRLNTNSYRVKYRKLILQFLLHLILVPSHPQKFDRTIISVKKTIVRLITKNYGYWPKSLSKWVKVNFILYRHSNSYIFLIDDQYHLYPSKHHSTTQAIIISTKIYVWIPTIIYSWTRNKKKKERSITFLELQLFFPILVLNCIFEAKK